MFYVYDQGIHGLIAVYNSDQATGIKFGVKGINYGAKANGIGAGLKNTALIIAKQGLDDTNSYAANICNDYLAVMDNVIYGDWYLPSKYELDLMYKQKQRVAGFADAFYWSSKEFSKNSAYYQFFNGGAQQFSGKDQLYNVRCIRAF